MMRILHTVGSLAPRDGGPSRTVPALCAALRAAEVDASILTCRIGASPDGDACAVPVHDVSYPSRSLRAIWSAPFRRAMNDCLRAEHVDVAHDHGVWLATNHAAARGARHTRVPLVVSPRGMLEPWSLRYRAWKKRVAWRAYQRRDLEQAALLHATSAMEAEHLRALGLRQPIAIIPNGVALPDPELARADTPERTALFLSRLHPKKGLQDLVNAWGSVRPAGWRLVIAGPDEGGHRAAVERHVEAAGLGAVVSFAGPVEGAAKMSLLASADLFVLPTHSENFGVVVAEALSYGVPVITTRGAPWQELESHACGWWTEIGPAPIAAALADATRRDPAELRAMGRRGRALVEQRYSWPTAARQMRAVYEWLLGGGSPPDCVLTH